MGDESEEGRLWRGIAYAAKLEREAYQRGATHALLLVLLSLALVWAALWVLS